VLTIRKALRLLAPLIILVTIVFWFSKGAHTGWSMDRVPVQMVDEITEIEYTVYQDRFVPGLDTVGIGFGAATLCFGLSFIPLFKSK
jgi:hypothetical protein